MNPIYNNFDSLDISFCGVVPEHILEQLRFAKNKAQEDRKDFAIHIGLSEFLVLVGESGAKGGYAFRFDTGVDGETWFIADSDKSDRWNIRVSVKSLNLALRGYWGAKEKILDILYNKLEVTGTYSPIEHNYIKERISRFDYCVDFQTDKFELIPNNIISHNKSKRTQNFSSSNDFVISGTARSLESVRIGSMPNRQLVIYNKLKEIITKKKTYWFELWNINKSEFKGQIWRIEIRAGKKELNQWNIRKFEDLEKKAGDVTLDILNSIKYVKPNENDSNSSRWPNEPFWDNLIKLIKKDLFDYISNANREEILTGIRNEVKAAFEKQILGNIRSYSALIGKELHQIPGVMNELSTQVRLNQKYDKEFELNKFQKSKDKYKLLE